ncbi:MAG: hypothetical protein AAFQ43_08265 [Bacteroidota bacterium]
MSDTVLVPLIVVGFAVVFPLFWLGIVGLIGRLGWGPLAEAFPAEDWPEEGYRVRFQSARIGASSYGNALHAVATDDGLYLRPMLLFRFGHAPVFIPWRAFVSVQTVAFGRRFVLRGAPDLVLYGRLAKAVEAAADAI